MEIYKKTLWAVNYLKINNKTHGFRMNRVLGLESINELLSVSGTRAKDGLYYLNHESISVSKLSFLSEFTSAPLKEPSTKPPPEI